MKPLKLLIILIATISIFVGNIVFGETTIGGISIGGLYRAQLLVTGQTTSYHDGDDGDLELGVARSYTVLTTGRYADSTNVTINSKTYVFSNACVQDNTTGKMWARVVPQTHIGPATDGKLFWDQYTLAGETCTLAAAGKTITADAATPFNVAALCIGRIFTLTGSGEGNDGPFTVTAISTTVITVNETVVNETSISLDLATTDDLIWNLADQANASSLGGYTDWRVPNINELRSIMDFSVSGPAIDDTTFPSTPSSIHWTSTTQAANVAKAWYIHFTNGLVSNTEKNNHTYHVRLVR